MLKLSRKTLLALEAVIEIANKLIRSDSELLGTSGLGIGNQPGRVGRRGIEHVPGGLLGVGLFVFAFPGFRQGLLYSPMGGFAGGMKLFPEVVATGFAVAVFVGLLAGLVPAIRSAQRSIPDGLRQVG